MFKPSCNGRLEMKYEKCTGMMPAKDPLIAKFLKVYELRNFLRTSKVVKYGPYIGDLEWVSLFPATLPMRYMLV